MLTFHIILVRWALRRGYSWVVTESIPTMLDMEAQETTTGLSAGDVAKLPCYHFSNGGEDVAVSSTCTICLESFSSGDNCRLLPQCKHRFHADCVDPWLTKCAVCPICRGTVGKMNDSTLPQGRDVTGMGSLAFGWVERLVRFGTSRQW
ncbi:hypothetical protein LUZ61_002987 [Rhynchospora tenuis]|uniref:RING-type domain-containing protein n=1 Tax=Rhynchospora tenuis TaxID=198213 RepID=A0AAD6ES91_9POAL|nr:hypothetical protein LUZ61_002987 [Rhynchospora tenuis]